MMAQALPQIKRVLSRLRSTQDDETPEVTPDPDYHRSTAPDSKMNMLLRFDTPLGPRTIVASGIPLSMASEITATMIRAGQYAEFIDQCQPLTVAERIKRKKLEKGRSAKQSNNVVGWDARNKLVAEAGMIAAERRTVARQALS
jgi:hypothetical protein